MKKLFILLVVVLISFSCNIFKSEWKHEYHFDSLEGWQDGSQNMKGEINYMLNGDTLEMYTRPNTLNRPKVRLTKGSWGLGEYQWRIFVPELGIGDRASIGAFLYFDDKHELDFEIGYGKEEERKKYNANKDEVLCYMTSQFYPFSSVAKPMKYNQWYDCNIRLSENNDGNYKVEWLVDNEIWKTLDLEYGSDFKFYIFCSMENLNFIGDHIPNQRNYAFFDWMKIK